MEKTKCSCGSTVLTKNMATHLKSVKHRKATQPKVEDPQMEKLRKATAKLAKVKPNCVLEEPVLEQEDEKEPIFRVKHKVVRKPTQPVHDDEFSDEDQGPEDPEDSAIDLMADQVERLEAIVGLLVEQNQVLAKLTEVVYQGFTTVIDAIDGDEEEYQDVPTIVPQNLTVKIDPPTVPNPQQ